MEDNSDSSAVPSLNIVVEEIFSSCNKNSNDVVPASTLIEFMTPHLSNHAIGLTQLRYVLDPNNENPLINRKSFYEAMQCWTARINESDSELFNLSFKESDVFDENGVPFHQSTPKPSLEPTTMKNSNDLLDFSNLSPTSFTANMKDNSIRMDKLVFIEERYQELEHKHLNIVRELALVKSQLATSEEQYAELKQDLDRTNKRLMLEQQVNADLQKSMDHNDEFKEEVCNTKKEKEHVHRMWLSTKRENVNLLAQLKSLTFEKELVDRKLNEMQRKEEQRKKEFVDLQTLFSLYEDENKLLKKSKNELEEELQGTKASLEHYTEVSEILKNKLEALTTTNKKKGSNISESNLTKDPSHSSNSSGTPLIQPLLRSSTPLKKMQHSWLLETGSFRSPRLQRQLSSPITPSGLDTPDIAKPKFLFNEGDILIRNSNSRGRNQIAKGDLCDPKRMLITNFAKSGRSKNLPPVGSSGEIADKEKKRCFSDRAETSLGSENSTFETIEDLDLSSISDNIRTSNGQDLLSELQECKFLDNHNKCFVEEHAELLRIVKEHNNCSQIISDKEKEIGIISAEIKATENEYKTFRDKYKNLENDIKCLEEQLKNTKIENEILAEKNNNYEIEIENLKQRFESNNKELQKMAEIEKKSLQLIEKIDHMKDKREQDIEKISNLVDEKKILQCSLETLIKEKDDLFSEKNNLNIENMNLTTIIEMNRKELNEMQNLKIKNEELEKKADLMRLDHEQNREEVKKLSNKLLICKDRGKSLVEKFNVQIKEQNEKIQFLKDFNNKLDEYVSDIQGTIEETRTKLNLLITYVEDNYVNVKYVHKTDEDSTSTGSNESGSYHTRSKQVHSSGRRSNYEKQQLKINKLEEKIEELENELSNEKSINERSKSFEYQINNWEMEKINLEEEKRSVLRELEATKYDLCMKEQMMKQFEEKYKFDLDNLNKSYEKEIELTKVAQIEALKNTELKEVYLMEQVEELKNKLSDVEKEKKLFENMLEKQGDKIVTLKKALSDISTSTEGTKNFEMLVTEKESMLNFNRQLLLKTNNSLKQVENRCLYLELLLDKCKMVLLQTVDVVLRSAIEVFHSHKETLKRKRVDPKVIRQFEILETKNPPLEDFTEKEVWIANNHLLLTSKLLKALVSDVEEYDRCSCGKDAATSKSVNKFTLRPPKLQFVRLPSCDPDISSSSMKDNESDQNVKFEFNPEIDEVMEKQEVKEAEIRGSLVNLGANDSETNWLDSCTGELSVEITDAPNNSTDNCTEKTDLKKSFRSVGVGDSSIDGNQSSTEKLQPVESKQRKCSSLITVTSMIICILAMCILFVHIECIRNGNDTIMCPLDFLVSIKNERPESY